MLKSKWDSNENRENMVELLSERYLPGVFQYMYYWVGDVRISEELTLKALTKALAKYGSCFKNERKFSTGIFSCARNEVLSYLKVSTAKPILLGLSTQEQEVISLRLVAALNNRMISKLLGLSESRVGTILHQSLYRLRDCM